MKLFDVFCLDQVDYYLRRVLCMKAEVDSLANYVEDADDEELTRRHPKDLAILYKRFINNSTALLDSIPENKKSSTFRYTV